MTYLTVVPLNAYRASTKKMLSSRQVAHATVMQSFAPNQNLNDADSRVLWSLDVSGRDVQLTILSPERASVEHIVETCGWTAAGDSSFQQVEYTPLVSSVATGSQYSFSVTVNPVISVTGSSKRIAVSEKDVAAWVASKFGREGMRIITSEVISYRIESFKRGNGKVTLALATVTGTFRVEDASATQKALVAGIGRAKGYGCGLISLNEQLV
jgi:CRISPR system Cascade subunit CasE